MKAAPAMFINKFAFGKYIYMYIKIDRYRYRYR